MVLLDEFEKADGNVFDLLLQLLGEGRLTDSQGRLADFRNAVVIMTSNLGADTFKDASLGFGESSAKDWREHFEREVKRYVRPEFLGRLDRIVPFEPLAKEYVIQIAERELGLLRQRAGLKFHGAELQFDREAVEWLSEVGYEPRYGARPLRRAIEEHVTVPLANALSRVKPDSKWSFRLKAEGGEVQILPEKHQVRSESAKRQEADIINDWQALGAMARCARESGPMRELENDLERNRRLIVSLDKKLQSAQGPRRIAKLRQDLAESKAIVESSQKLKTRLLKTCEDVCAKHLQLMLAWYRNEEISWQNYESESKVARSQLRQVTEDVISGRVAVSNLASLLVIGASRSALEVLWMSYQLVIKANGWTSDTFLVKAYDPLLDEESSEYRRRKSEKKDVTIDPADRPNFRFAQMVGEAEIKHCDLFRPKNSAQFLSELGSSHGFALEVYGEGVSSWLGNEHGTTHFFDPRANGPKRRVRCKTQVTEGRVYTMEVGEDWSEVSSAPARDPFRIFQLDQQKLQDCEGNEFPFAKGKLHEALKLAIEDEHERALWKAIGFNGIVAVAQLHTEPHLDWEL